MKFKKYDYVKCQCSANCRFYGQIIGVNKSDGEWNGIENLPKTIVGHKHLYRHRNQYLEPYYKIINIKTLNKALGINEK